jgi:hypothetical protein
VIGAGLVGVGVLSMLGTLSGVDGLWLAIVGGFLMMASRAEGGASALLETLEGLTAADVMAQPGVGPGWLTVDAFLREYTIAGPDTLRPTAFLVEQWGGGLAGLTPTVAMEAVPPMQRFQVRAGDCAVPVARLPVFAPELPAGEVVTKMNEQAAAWGLVVASGQIVGVVSIQDMAGAVERAKAKASAAVDSSSWSLTRG